MTALSFNPLKRVLSLLTRNLEKLQEFKTLSFNPLKRVLSLLTKMKSKNRKLKIMFQSPKTGLCFSHPETGQMFYWNDIETFQSPKTGLCFSHQISTQRNILLLLSFNPLKRVYAFLTTALLCTTMAAAEKFQSPKTGLCFSHEPHDGYRTMRENNVSIP